MNKLIISILSFLLLISCSNEPKENKAAKEKNNTSSTGIGSFAFPYIKWNNSIYTITDTPAEEVDKPLGEITNYSTTETGETLDNSSNFYQVGTKLWSINNIDSSQEIAVETGQNQYIKAIVTKDE
ncbi:hypothetical protein NYE80_20520 [Paenibacillus sp. FSL H7-0357]|jgi:hypothetical protein|uniref:hypothetical protein n=1 Tax=Paenibacillus sp. FSL H7-0357 TaxID=1536774 RepID=UPI00068ABB3A|nr:hypothetical protein [Paenibacillus sp. FSL H7-0357]